jgi:hypothetical protein
MWRNFPDYDGCIREYPTFEQAEAFLKQVLNNRQVQRTPWRTVKEYSE